MIQFLAAVILQLCAVSCPHLGEDTVTREAVAYEIAEKLSDAATSHGVDRMLVVALAWHESRFDETAVSSVGAFGVLQVHPANWGKQALHFCLVDPASCLWWQSWAGAEALAHYRKRCGGYQKAIFGYRSGRCGLPRRRQEKEVLELWYAMRRSWKKNRGVFQS